MNRPQLGLAWNACLQVTCVSANVMAISRGQWVAAFITSAALSWLWTSNVKKVAFGSGADRAYYATGAGIGCVAGMLLTTLLSMVLGD